MCRWLSLDMKLRRDPGLVIQTLGYTGCCGDYTYDSRCKPGLTQEPGLSWADRSCGLLGPRGHIRKGGGVLCSARQAVSTAAH